MAGPAVGRQRAAEDGAGVGVTLGGGEHLWKATAMRGRLITIEGLDGSGKTTLADALVDALRSRRARRGAAARARRRRALRAHPRAGQGSGAGRRPARRGAALRRGPRAARGRARRARAGGGDVGAARPLRRLLAGLPGRRARAGGRGGAPRSTTSPPAACAPTARCCCAPTPATRAARQAGRGEAPDRLEREDDAFFDAIAGAYDALAAAEPERFRVLDAGAEPAAVLAAARAALADLG